MQACSKLFEKVLQYIKKPAALAVLLGLLLSFRFKKSGMHSALHTISLLYYWAETRANSVITAP